MVLFLSKEYLDRNITFFFDASHTIYHRFLCCGILWFAKHYFQGVLGSRLGVISKHRYLMGRFPLQGFYLCCHVLSTAPSFILWWPKLEILFVSLHHIFTSYGGLRCRPILQEHSLYIVERTRKAVYNVRCLCFE
jgi:hypothetical protein